MVDSVRHDMSHLSVTAREYAIPRPPAVLHPRLHLVAAEPRYATELLGLDGVFRTVVTLGVDGVQSGHAWECAKG